MGSRLVELWLWRSTAQAFGASSHIVTAPRKGILSPFKGNTILFGIGGRGVRYAVISVVSCASRSIVSSPASPRRLSLLACRPHPLVRRVGDERPTETAKFSGRSPERAVNLLLAGRGSTVPDGALPGALRQHL